jgi:uncharacterized protein
MATSNPFLHLKSRYTIFGVYIISSIFMGLLYGLLSNLHLLPWPANDPIGILVLFIAIFCVLCSALYWQGRRLGVRFDYLFGDLRLLGANQPFRSRSLLSAISTVLGPIFFLLLLVISVLLFSFSSFRLMFYPLSLLAPGPVEGFLQELLSPTESVLPGFYQVMTVFVTVIFAPVTEEFIFRGFLLQRWGSKWGLRAGVMASSLLFGLLHVHNPIGLTMFGLIMALLYVRTHNLWVPILAHALNNLMALLPEWLSTTESTTQPFTIQDFQQSWWLGLVFLALSAPMLFRFIASSWPRAGDQLPYMVNSRRSFG